MKLLLTVRCLHLTLYWIFIVAAPSPVSVVRKGHTGKSSIALSWAEPDRPNGIILEYEIKYFEKVKNKQMEACVHFLDISCFLD